MHSIAVTYTRCNRFFFYHEIFFPQFNEIIGFDKIIFFYTLHALRCTRNYVPFETRTLHRLDYIRNNRVTGECRQLSLLYFLFYCVILNTIFLLIYSFINVSRTRCVVAIFLVFRFKKKKKNHDAAAARHYPQLYFVYKYL